MAITTFVTQKFKWGTSVGVCRSRTAVFCRKKIKTIKWYFLLLLLVNRAPCSVIMQDVNFSM